MKQRVRILISLTVFFMFTSIWFIIESAFDYQTYLQSRNYFYSTLSMDLLFGGVALLIAALFCAFSAALDNLNPEKRS